ncbi:glycoside hydrolase domain-containing protein [Agrococcus jejuensis]|uniref:Alpha-1,2-mannosidase, putative n=1 Tax=Agrococcus jejuensis TaxID=399736 RepID=A0A1G8GBU5_9MICO|nr:glycoside hydrolase domain-containing protein [Agrococcus jejuensis]SDH91771.1 alpha-1,2-mannosidase, putative [Agrococcus jejuensis]
MVRIADVDPFLGTAPTDLPAPSGLAATWWWPKPQIGNTHPGATAPLGMVSACAYSGAYPTGYGRFDLSTEGIPPAIRPDHVASGFTHFQQSGTGAIRKYYNYFRVTPLTEPLDGLGRQFELLDEQASPGRYSARLDNGVLAELTAGPKSVVHRYTFPRHKDARVVIDCSIGGLQIPFGETVPLRAHLQLVAPGVAQGEIVVEGAPLVVHVEVRSPRWRQLLWYDRRLMPGGSRLDFDSIRPTTLRPFGMMWAGPTEQGDQIEVAIGFSLRGPEQARANLYADCGTTLEGRFDERLAATETLWSDALGRIEIDAGTQRREQIFGTALYHSLVKPAFAEDENPFSPRDGDFVFDLCTMWDIYRTQLPLLTALAPDRAIALANSLIVTAEEEGNFPIGYRMARGADRFARQGSALAHTFIADLAQLGLEGVDWELAIVHMLADLRRGYGEDLLRGGVAHPITHHLDLAFGYHCTARVARLRGDRRLARELDDVAARWVDAYDPQTGLAVDSTYYEGGKWNYSFRLMHDMAARIAIAGGDDPFVGLLDRFFGFGGDAVRQPGVAPGAEELLAGYALGRFEGLNNEPDMDAPWAYHYAGRPDRTAEVVHAALEHQFGTGPGGLPGNDDSGGISSWYVWATLGLLPVAGQNVTLLSTPSVREATMQMPGGALHLETTGFVEPTRDSPAQHVQAVHLDGVELRGSSISTRALHRGGRLRIDLGPEPNGWGTVHRPPSRPDTA